MFRLDHGQQLVFLAPKKPDAKPTRVSINIILFILTVLSVMLVGAEKEVTPTLPGILGQIIAIFETLFSGWPYALSLMSILLAHELGHYFMSRHHKTAANSAVLYSPPISAAWHDGRRDSDAGHAEK